MKHKLPITLTGSNTIVYGILGPPRASHREELSHLTNLQQERENIEEQQEQWQIRVPPTTHSPQWAKEGREERRKGKDEKWRTEEGWNKMRRLEKQT